MDGYMTLTAKTPVLFSLEGEIGGGRGACQLKLFANLVFLPANCVCVRQFFHDSIL